MTLTTEEMRAIVSSTLIRYLVNEERVDFNSDKSCNLVRWVDSQDFEFILEEIREEW